jgi:hypothetical protein
MFIFQCVVASVCVVVAGGGGIAALVAGFIEDHQNKVERIARARARVGSAEED